MTDLTSLDTDTLIDMLAEQTASYIKMLHSPSVDANEFYRCRLMVKELQSEIKRRKKADNPESPLSKSAALSGQQ